MGAHAFSYEHRDLISAIIVNTCMMNEYYLHESATYPAGKSAVFLASPTDFRYREMRRDGEFLLRLHWRVRWKEFQGGHRLAPESLYDEALEWLLPGLQ